MYMPSRKHPNVRATGQWKEDRLPGPELGIARPEDMEVSHVERGAEHKERIRPHVRVEVQQAGVPHDRLNRPPTTGSTDATVSMTPMTR